MSRSIHSIAVVFAVLIGFCGLVGGGDASAAPLCAPGWTLSGGNCTQPASCESGYTDTGSGCSITRTQSYPATCVSAAQRVNGNMCMTYDIRTRKFTDPMSTPICDRGGTLNRGTCILSSTAQTIPKRCNMGATLQGSMCVMLATISNAASAPPRPATPTPNQTFNPYKNLYTVQGWEQARRQNPNAQEDPNSSPYAVAARGQEVSDANGNFVTGIDLGDKVQRGQRVYKRVAVKQINGRTVSTYIEACPPGANPATCRDLGQPTL